MSWSVMTGQCNPVRLVKKLSLQLDSGAGEAGLAHGGSRPWPRAGERGGLCPAWFQRSLFNQDAGPGAELPRGPRRHSRADRAGSSSLQTVTSGFTVWLVLLLRDAGPSRAAGGRPRAVSRGAGPGGVWGLRAGGDSVVYPASTACFILRKTPFHFLLFYLLKAGICFCTQDRTFHLGSQVFTEARETDVAGTHCHLVAQPGAACPRTSDTAAPWWGLKHRPGSGPDRAAPRRRPA